MFFNVCYMRNDVCIIFYRADHLVIFGNSLITLLGYWLNPLIVQAITNLHYRYSDETPKMWCSRIRVPFRKLIEYNPTFFSKNEYIHMTERLYEDGKFGPGRRTFHIYCTVCDSLVFI